MTDTRIAVRGTRRAMRELVDGTIRVQIDIDPSSRKAFLDHFGAIDIALAIVPLVGAAAAPDTQWSEEERATLEARGKQPLEINKIEPKGGELAKLAGIWCNDENFQRWVTRAVSPAIRRQAEVKHNDASAVAAHLVRWMCEVDSRAELDHDDKAKAAFNKLIRIPYSDYLKEQGK